MAFHDREVLVKDAIRIILDDESLIEHHPDLTPQHLEALSDFVFKPRRLPTGYGGP